jgi:type IV pilus assembly protein PilC
LRGEGYFVTALGPETGASASTSGGPSPRAQAGIRVSAKTLGIFCQQLGTLLRAGVPITQALRVSSSQPGKRGWSETIDRVRQHVESGESLSGALSHYPRTFPTLMLRLVEAGETSGSLDATFLRLGETFTAEHELRQKVIGSLTYPAVILVMAAVVIVVLLTFVLPNFVSMFSDLGKLPLPTRMLLATGDWVQKNGLYLLVALVAAVVGLTSYFRTEGGAMARDSFLLRVPLLRDLLLQIEFSRFGRTFGTLLAGGVPALQALQIVSRVTSNRRVSQAFERTAEAVRGGASLAGALEKTRLVPPMLTQMVAVGETTGSLDMILSNVADLYDREVENRLKQLTTLIEPAVIVVVGVIVATIIASVMLPMFQMVSQVGA